MQSQSISSALLTELVGALGEGHRVTEDRLGRIEDALRPMFVSLPKNNHGSLGRPAVRYVLHRLFVQRHGMFLKGLAPDGQAWNTSLSSGILDSQVPAAVQDLLEERSGSRGLGIREISVLAATIEHLIHDEAIDRLKAAYTALGVPLDGKSTEEQIQDVIDVYMVFFVGGRNHSTLTPEQVRVAQVEVEKQYASWPLTQDFARKVWEDVVDTLSTTDAATFATASKVVEEIGEKYGRWYDIECRGLKDSLIKLGDQGAGRVLLKDFYGAALNGSWQFSESADYLRELGALDESDPSRVSVIVPNYINAPSNCLATSSMFSVCCIDECEALLSHLEHEVLAPSSMPQRLIDVVSNLPSATVEAPRSLPSSLIDRLHDVARHHSGRVPLHGRLFSQWMHHAYPRECPYPHLSGTTRPQTAEEWLKEDGRALHASRTVMEKYAMVGAEPTTASSSESPVASKQAGKRKEEELLPWDETEELFVAHFSAAAHASAPRSWWAEAVRCIMLLSVLGAMGLWLKGTLVNAFVGSDKLGMKMRSL